jgi:hypothetical protein
VLVKDDLTQFPFDLQHSHVTTYHSSLKARLVKDDTRSISQLIQNTAADPARRWSLVRNLGLDAKLRTEAVAQQDPIAAAILDIREELNLLRSRLEYRPPVDVPLPSAVELPRGRILSPPKQQERDEILAVLEEERGNAGRAAQRLGMSKSRLYSLAKSLDISIEQTRR